MNLIYWKCKSVSLFEMAPPSHLTQICPSKSESQNAMLFNTRWCWTICYSFVPWNFVIYVKKRKEKSVVFFLFYILPVLWRTTFSLSARVSCTSVSDPAYFLFSAEELLNNFAQQTGAWRHCLFFLSNTRNEYVMMYSLTVFEVSAVGGWYTCCTV